MHVNAFVSSPMCIPNVLRVLRARGGPSPFLNATHCHES